MTIGQAITRQQQVDQITTVIFDAEMGSRLGTVRMKYQWDQFKLAELLGTSQQIISRIERGHLKCPRNPFSMARLKALFTEDLGYILLGSNAEKYSGPISENYWKVKLARGKSNV